jgi:predicted nucleic acid-binding protein
VEQFRLTRKRRYFGRIQGSSEAPWRPSKSYRKVINLIRERAEGVKVRSSAEISPDPKDDAFCLCAESGNADFIVTLNPKDFPEKRLKSKVILPSELIR